MNNKMLWSLIISLDIITYMLFRKNATLQIAYSEAPSAVCQCQYRVCSNASDNSCSKLQFVVYRSYMACNLQVGETNFNTSNWNAFSLYKALKDDVTFANFMEYLMITQEPWQYGANNVYFWLEVQKCKVRIFDHNYNYIFRECAKCWLACYT